MRSGWTFCTADPLVCWSLPLFASPGVSQGYSSLYSNSGSGSTNSWSTLRRGCAVQDIVGKNPQDAHVFLARVGLRLDQLAQPGAGGIREASTLRELFRGQSKLGYSNAVSLPGFLQAFSPGRFAFAAGIQSGE